MDRFTATSRILNAVHAVQAQATAPGKVILMGEHAAVYGVPAVVASLGLLTVARVEPAVGHSDLDLDLADLGLAEECTWEEVVEYGDQRRKLWRAYQADPSRASFSALRAGEATGLVKIVAAETLRSLECRPDSRVRLKLSVSSELPMGSGFGSSASVAVAVAAVLSASLTGEGDPDHECVASVALEAEKRQHGQPSGVDHTTVMRGGFLFLAREGDFLEVEELARPDWFRRGLLILDTGSPAETTGEVVAAVRDLKERRPRAFASALGRIDESVRAFAEALGEVEPAWEVVLSAAKSAERGLEDLGVVPETVRGAIHRIEAAGGAAKVSGAGALSGDSAGSLIVFWPPRASGDPVEILAGYVPLAADLGVGGLECRLAGREAHAEA